MTRETKVGLVVAASFLCLVSIVVASKIHGGQEPPVDSSQTSGSVIKPEPNGTPSVPRASEQPRQDPKPAQFVQPKRDTAPSETAFPPLNAIAANGKSDAEIKRDLTAALDRNLPNKADVVLPNLPVDNNGSPRIDPIVPPLVKENNPAQLAQGPPPPQPSVPLPSAPLPSTPLPSAPIPSGPLPSDLLPKDPASKPMEMKLDPLTGPLPAPNPLDVPKPAAIEQPMPRKDDVSPAFPKPPQPEGPRPGKATPDLPPIVPAPLNNPSAPLPDPTKTVAPPMPPVVAPRENPNIISDPVVPPPVIPRDPVRDPTVPPIVPPQVVDNPPRPNPIIGSQQAPTTPPINVPPTIPSAGNPAPLVRTSDSGVVQVLQGETSFAQLSRRLYGNDKYADALLAFNRDHRSAVPQGEVFASNQPALSPGQQVLHPPLGLLERDYGKLIGGGASAVVPTIGTAPAVNIMRPTPLGQAPTSNGPATGTPGGGYRVTNPSGERIRDVAQRLLGDPNRWTEIYRLNPQIQPQYALPPGTDLKLP